MMSLMTLGNVLTLIFMTLKLTGNIDWSWIFILLPVIISSAIWLTLNTLIRTSPKFRMWLSR